MEYVYLCASAFLAGAINSLAGGGTLLTFPALLMAPGVDAVMANATSSVALVPGSLAGAWGFRRELVAVTRWLKLLIAPSLVGGLVGALLVTVLPKEYFAHLVPWLILTATLLFLFQPWIARWTGIGRSHAEPALAERAALIGFQFVVAVYGGYFGAGIGILMLSALSLMGVGDIHRMNAAKTFLATAINGVAIAVFVAQGIVNWPYALAMAVAGTLGGYAGARGSRRIPRGMVRWAVIVVGLGLAGYYFVKPA